MKTEREQVIRVVRKRRRHGGHHGGAWKVAFADFMTSMMALFLVLWLITQSSEVRSAIAGYFQDPLGRGREFGSSIMPGTGQPAMPTRPEISLRMADSRRDRLLALSERIKRAVPDSLDALGLGAHVEVTITDEGLRISLLEDSTDIFFASGASSPLPRASVLFASIGQVLGSTGYALVVEGHTDALPYVGRPGYDNWELSADRANAVRRALLTGGLRSTQVTAVRGLADREPRLPENPRAPQNRRVTILVAVPEDETPGRGRTDS